MTKSTQPPTIELSIHIAATPPTIFRFFSDPERFRLWMGQASSIDPRVGGELTVVHPSGPPAISRIVEMVTNERIVFTWGHGEAAKSPTADSSRVTITLKPVSDGTIVTLRHAGIVDERERHGTTGGWRYYLGQLSAAVWCTSMKGRLEALVDVYISAWNEPDGARRLTLLTESFAESGSIRDRYGCIDGRDPLNSYIGGVQMMLQGAKLERSGPIEQCHAFARYPWRILLPNGHPMAGGTQFVEFNTEGLILRSIGFWDGPPS